VPVQLPRRILHFAHGRHGFPAGKPVADPGAAVVGPEIVEHAVVEHFSQAVAHRRAVRVADLFGLSFGVSVVRPAVVVAVPVLGAVAVVVLERVGEGVERLSDGPVALVPAGRLLGENFGRLARSGGGLVCVFRGKKTQKINVNASGVVWWQAVASAQSTRSPNKTKRREQTIAEALLIYALCCSKKLSETHTQNRR
jgi:hypothetical protein